MNMNILAVDVKHMSVYDFLKDGETEQELLNRAEAYKQKEIEDWTRNYLGYPTREDFKIYLEEAKNTEYKTMSWNEFQTMQKSFYLDRPVKETTKEQFDDMLGCLPPLKWCNVNGVEMFCLCEMLTGNYTDQYAKVNGKYYTKLVDVTDKNTWINNYINQEVA